MSFRASQEFRSSLAPSDFLKKLRESTIPFEEIINLGNPVESYLNHLKESFTGDQTIVARIEGNEARLMPIGIWPIKGRSAIANCGYRSCRVEARGTGAVIRSSYELAWIYKIAIPAFLIFGFLMVLAILGLVLYGADLDGRWGLVGAATFSIILCVGFPLYYLRGAKTQARLTGEFLEKFVAKNG